MILKYDFKYYIGYDLYMHIYILLISYNDFNTHFNTHFIAVFII